MAPVDNFVRFDQPCGSRSLRCFAAVTDCLIGVGVQDWGVASKYVEYGTDIASRIKCRKNGNTTSRPDVVRSIVGWN